MSDSQTDDRTLLLEIVDTLAADGLAPDCYQLQDSIDVEALETLVDSAGAGAGFELHFSVEGRRVQVTPDGVELIDTPADRS